MLHLLLPVGLGTAKVLHDVKCTFKKKAFGQVYKCILNSFYYVIITMFNNKTLSTPIGLSIPVM